MLFSKDIKKCCEYCAHGSPIGKSGILCDKHGPVTPDHRCRSFSYDPLRRTPAPAVTLSSVPEESFKL